MHIKSLCYLINRDLNHWVQVLPTNEVRTLNIVACQFMHITSSNRRVIPKARPLHLSHPPNPVPLNNMRLSTFLVVTSLAIVGSAKPTKKPEPPARVEVTLTPQSGSVVKVSVKNASKQKLDFFQRGSLLDDNPVHKLQVRAASGWFTFDYQLHRLL